MFSKRLLIALFLLCPAKGFAADSTVAALAAASALAGSELFYCVQSSADKKCTASQISTFVLSTFPATTCTNQFVRSIAAATGVGTCATISLTADVTGTLPVANGGTGKTSIVTPTICAGFSGGVCPGSGTNATYTTPANVTWVEFFLVGGGGGGGGGNGSATPGTAGGSTCLAASGTACSSSIITATGAVGSLGGASNAGGAPGACTVGGNVVGNTGNPGTLAGSSIAGVTNGAPGAGGASPRGGAGVPNSNGAAGTAASNSGSGGAGGDAATAATIAGAGGSSGGWCDHIIASPAASYVYTLGAAGVGQTAGAGGVGGGNGGSGGIYSIEHYGN